MDDFISYQTYSKFPLLYENTVSEAAETRISILRFSIVNVNDSYNYAPHRHTGPELMFSVRGSYDCTLNDREFSVPPGHGIFIQPGDIHCDHCGIVPVPEDQLPLTLPEVSKYEPSGTGESPLVNIDSWVNTTCPVCGRLPYWAFCLSA